MRIKHNTITLFTAIFFSVCNLSFTQAQTPSPNILLIQVDDMGFDDLSVNGNTLSKTPNIDKLSEQSVRFNNFMLNSVCSPTRASLLTGRDFWRTGVSAMHGGKDFLNLDETTFADVMQKNGYATGMWGKWHSGKADGYWPWDRGFDEGYYAKLYHYFPSNGWHNQYPKLTTHNGKWSAEVIVDYAIDFISRKKDAPFLAYVSFLTCHDIWKAPENYIAKYRKEGRTERYATLLAMLEYMDNQVGRLLQFVSDQGLDENTVVIFMSDNGPNKGDTNPEEWALRNNHGFLGNKARLWQNGLKSPLYIKWQNKYTPADVNRLVTITDMFPTLLDITGISIPADNKPIDGRSFKQYLEGNTKVLEPKKGVFAHWFPVWEHKQFHPVQQADKKSFDFEKQRITMISEDYKLLHNPVNVDGSPSKKNGAVLIDLKSDPMETTNIATNKPELVKEMKHEMQVWFDEILKEEGSFSPPVFQIGWKGKKESDVLAFGTSKTVGCENNSHNLKEFSDVGDTIEYTIQVKTPGTYIISMETNKSKLDGFTIETSSNNQFKKTALVSKSKQEIGELSLSEGQHKFTVTIVDKDLPKSPHFGELKLFRFVRVR